MKKVTYRRRLGLNCAYAVFLTAGVLAISAAPARAYTFNTSPDWDVELDTNVSFSLGVRAQPRDSKIANNPLQQNDEYKFPNMGNITTSRFEATSELAVAYKTDTGFDISVDGWKDFAYDGGVKTHPGDIAPGVPYSVYSSAPDGHYSSYVNNFYDVGGELENAFAFKNFTLAGMPVSVKVGRFTEYWGNALFAGGQSISYGQSPLDLIKAVDSPGTEVKDLFLPRGQFSAHITPIPQLTLGFQYEFEYRYTRYPEGGTFLGVADPFFIGPTNLEGFKRGPDKTPPNVDGNFGFEALWSPGYLNNATFGAYFRQFDDVTPYGAFNLTPHTGGAPTFNVAYAKHIRMYALSLDNTIGTASTSFEMSIRQNTGLDTTAPGPSPNDGARGDLLNLVANAVLILPPTPFYQTGGLAMEIAGTHLMEVTHNRNYFNGVGYACSYGGSEAGLGKRDGCATRDLVDATIVFDPQWLQVFPGIDIDAPIVAGAGLYGNGQTVNTGGVGDADASVQYSLGVHAFIKQKYNIKLDYSGFQSPTGHNAQTLAGAYYSTGSGNYMWNDKGQIQLTLSTAF